MGINLATQRFREDLIKLINESSLPICLICTVLNEAKESADKILVATIQTELQQEQRGKEESEDGKLD